MMERGIRKRAEKTANTRSYNEVGGFGRISRLPPAIAMCISNSCQYPAIRQEISSHQNKFFIGIPRLAGISAE